MKKTNNNENVINNVKNTSASKVLNVFFSYGIFDEDDECVVDATTMLRLSENQVKTIAKEVKKHKSENPTLGMLHDIEQDVVDKIFNEEFVRVLPGKNEDDYYVHVDYPLPEELMEAVQTYMN